MNTQTSTTWSDKRPLVDGYYWLKEPSYHPRIVFARGYFIHEVGETVPLKANDVTGLWWGPLEVPS